MPSRILSSSARTSVCGEAVVEAAAAASGETATAAALPTARPSSVRRESGADIELSPVVRAPGGRRVLGHDIDRCKYLTVRWSVLGECQVRQTMVEPAWYPRRWRRVAARSGNDAEQDQRQADDHRQQCPQAIRDARREIIEGGGLSTD